MGSFGDLLYDLATAGGRGLEEGMAGKRKEDREAAAFRRMTPLQIERQRGVKGMEEEYTIRGEGRQAKAAEEALTREETALSGILGPILEQYMPPTMPAPERAEAELPSPYKAPARLPKAAVSPLLSFLKPPKAATGAGRAPTMTELYIQASQGDPVAQAAIKRYQETQVGIFGGKLDVTGEAPPDVTAGERKTLTERAGRQAELENVKRLYTPDMVGPVAGRLGALQQRLGVGPFAPSPEQAEMHAGVAALRNRVIQEISGAAVSNQEAQRLIQELPTMTDPPSVFQSKLVLTERNLRRLQELQVGALTQPRRMAPRRIAPRPDWELVE